MYKQESKTDVDRPELDDPTDGESFHDSVVMGEPEGRSARLRYTLK
jgi:hypothetical protein